MDTPAADRLDSSGHRPLPIEFVDGPESYSDRVKMLLQERGVSTDQKGSRVILHEDVYSVPGWYSDELGWRDWTKEQWEADPLAQATLAHIRKLHGRNLAFVALHRDEKTPHFHVGSVPLVERERQRRGRPSKDSASKPRATVISWALDHRHLRGEKHAGPGRPDGRQKLSAMQDAYHAAVQHLGIDRGLKIVDVPVGERKDYRLKASAENETRQRKLDDDRAAADARLAAALRTERDAQLGIDEYRRQAAVAAAEIAEAHRLKAEAAAVLAEAQRSRRAADEEALRVSLERHHVETMQAAVVKDRQALEATVAEKVRAGIEAGIADARRTFERGYNDVLQLVQQLREGLKLVAWIRDRAESIEERIWNGPRPDREKAMLDGTLEKLNDVMDPSKVPVVPELTPAARLAATQAAAQRNRGIGS
jgi:hypothetical protein